MSGRKLQNAWLQASVQSVTLNKSSNHLHVCLSFSSWKMGILLLTYLTVGGQRITGLWGFLTDCAICYRHHLMPSSQVIFQACTGPLPFSEIGSAWLTFKAQDWNAWILVHLKWVYWGIVHCLENFKFPLCILAFTKSMIWSISKDFLQCKSQATVI